MKYLDESKLAAVTGGMDISHFRRSTNVEDRRGMTPWQSRHVKSPPVAPLPPLVRHPNDLSHQAGLDDIRAHYPRQKYR